MFRICRCNHGKDVVLSLIFPRLCLNCHQPITKTDIKDAIATDIWHAMASFVCPKCMIDFETVESPRCLRCGESIKNNKQIETCHACARFQNTFDKVRFVGMYQGIFKELIHLYKFKNKRQLAKPFARMLKQKLACCQELGPIDFIAPVPLHISRLRTRGFNQALLMLWQWRSEKSKIIPKLLIRNRPTKTQTHLTREQRMENMVSAFGLNPNISVDGKRILLVDDVYTTGSTVHACSVPLREGGAKCVHVLTLARA